MSPLEKDESEKFNLIATKVCEKLLARAAELESNAGYSGAMNDGGASSLRSEVECFKAGLEKRFPKYSEWRSAQTRVEKELKTASDPEYAEYARLKQTFEKP